MHIILHSTVTASTCHCHSVCLPNLKGLGSFIGGLPTDRIRLIAKQGLTYALRGHSLGQHWLLGHHGFHSHYLCV